MRKNWKLIASGMKLNIPEADLEKLDSILDALDAAFRPLVETIPHDVEPAVTFRCQPEERS